MPNDPKTDLELALRARIPLVALVTYEEARALNTLLLPLAQAWREGRCFVWTTTTGFNLISDNTDEPISLSAPDPMSALEVVAAYDEPAMFVLKDFHHYLENAAVLRRLRDLAAELPALEKQIVFLSPRFRVPEDLEKDVQVIDLPPPPLPELGALLDEQIARCGSSVDLTPEGRERLLNAALGLTAVEAGTVFAKAMVGDGTLSDDDVDLVLDEKKQIVRRAGILEFYEAAETLDDVGGLDNLKAWLDKRYAAFSEDARDYGLPEPKGILLLGVQGCGKSLVAKAVSRAWKLPLLRLDVGRIFGRYIGESEAAIRRVIQTAEAVAPAILWVDEIEKGFAGAAGDAHDTGVSARVLATFLTWLQEKGKPVFVLATANHIRNLPPELLRKGRFDELFFVDLPMPEEREAILRVHLQKRGRDCANFDVRGLAAQMDSFTGAEIEQTINEALHDAYADGRREVTTADISHAASQVIPLAVTMREAITGMRNWAGTRARPASCPAERLSGARESVDVTG